MRDARGGCGPPVKGSGAEHYSCGRSKKASLQSSLGSWSVEKSQGQVVGSQPLRVWHIPSEISFFQAITL